MIVSILISSLLLIGIYVGSHRLSGVQTALVALTAAAGFTLVIFPNVASTMALAVGVGRGTDLLLYVSIVGGLFVGSHLYFRSKHQEWQIIELTRALAIAQPSRDLLRPDSMTPSSTTRTGIKRDEVTDPR